MLRNSWERMFLDALPERERHELREWREHVRTEGFIGSWPKSDGIYDLFDLAFHAYPLRDDWY